MLPVLRITLITLALGGWVAADLPRKAPISKYRKLWNESPFTSKPPEAEAGPVANPLDDYALAGVSPIGGGYRVTLLNKKSPTERITVDSDRDHKDGFKILAVTRKAGNPLGTIVRMSSGPLTGTVAFDEKLLTLTPPPAAKAAPKGGKTATAKPGQKPVRQPRPRVVPPPTKPSQSNQQRSTRRR